MKMSESMSCDVCRPILLHISQPPSSESTDDADTHSCLKTLIQAVKRNTDSIQQQDQTIRDQNALLDRLIHELDDVRTCLRDKQEELSLMKDSLEKVSQSQGPALVVEPEHKSLIDRLRQEGHIKSDKVYQVMLSVDFRDFSQDGVSPNKR